MDKASGEVMIDSIIKNVVREMNGAATDEWLLSIFRRHVPSLRQPAPVDSAAAATAAPTSTQTQVARKAPARELVGCFDVNVLRKQLSVLRKELSDAAPAASDMVPKAQLEAAPKTAAAAPPTMVAHPDAGLFETGPAPSLKRENEESSDRETKRHCNYGMDALTTVAGGRPARCEWL